MQRSTAKPLYPGHETDGALLVRPGEVPARQRHEAGVCEPNHVKKLKGLNDSTPSKNDCKDPKTIAALVNKGRFSYPYMPVGIYAEIRSLSNLRS